MKTKTSFKELNDMREILYIYYLHYGRPAGVVSERKTSEKGNHYVHLLNAPFAHQGAAKAILKEIYSFFGSFASLEDFWPFFGEIVREANKRGCRGIYDIRDRFPIIFKELGGIGRFLVSKICSARRLEHSDGFEILNDGIRFHLVKDVDNDEQVLDVINMRYYQIKDLKILG